MLTAATLRRSARRLAAPVVLAALMAAGSAFAADGAGELVMRRLTPEQYRQTIADIFGRTIKAGGRFEPDVRHDGLLALGTGRVSVTASGIEQYDAMARVVAAQVVSETRRDTLIPCKPAAANAPDEACAAAFLTKVGRLLYRRPLTGAETKAWVGIAGESAAKLKDFYAGLGTSLASMMVSLPFLFRQEIAATGSTGPDTYRMDAFGKASRLSFFLWNTTPDSELLNAAESGELDTPAGLSRQVDRLLSSPRLEAGVRAFFTDMLGFSEFESLAKDRAIYPKFSGKVARESEEQTLRTIVDLLVKQDGDYRGLFISRNTFLTTTLASIYRVPLARTTPNTTGEDWQSYTFPDSDPRAGILSHVSFLALHSHPGRSSPTLRGKALREILLCQQVPNPPGNVDFAVVQDTNNPVYKTARARLSAHATQPMCAGCHKITDPMGLALEIFDSTGEYRATENGEVIDTSGSFDNTAFANAGELGRIIHDSPAATNCVVNRMFSYATGRSILPGDVAAIEAFNTGFARSGYKVTNLLRRMALSDALYRVTPPSKPSADTASALPSVVIVSSVKEAPR